MSDEWMEHRCPQLREAEETRIAMEHRPCYGPAVETVARDEEGMWWALSNTDEYASPISYCPFCGKHLYEEGEA